MHREHLFFIDIETVPQFSSYAELQQDMQVLWQKKAALIQADADPVELFSERAGIYAEFGKIICIGLGFLVYEEEQWQLRVKTLHGHNEKELLQEFAQTCNGFFKSPEKLFCGHNIKEFDIPYICRRMLIQNEPMPLILKELQSRKPWDNPMLDTMQFWKFGEYKNFVSVELLASVLGIPTPKDDIYGGDVARVYWEEQNLSRIVTYCNKDIVTVAQLYLRLQGLPLLQEDQIHIRS